MSRYPGRSQPPNPALVPDVGWPHDFTVAVHIDGEPLTETVRRIEASHRRTAGEEPSVTRYQWVRAGVMLLPGRHLLGIPASLWCPGFSEVLVCSCGEAACGAIAVSVRVWPEHVAWLAWRQFPLAEACPYCEFRPLFFSRPQYDAELGHASDWWQRARLAAVRGTSASGSGDWVPLLQRGISSVMLEGTVRGD